MSVHSIKELSVIRRREECIEFKWNGSGVNNVVIRPFCDDNS